MTSDEILISIRRIMRAVNIESKRCEKEYGLSIPQLLVLHYICARPNLSATNKDIKDHLMLNASTVTGILKRLEKKGWIARLPRPKDQRGVNIALTEKGMDLIESTPRPLQERLSSAIQKLSLDDKRQLKRSLDFMVHALEAEDLDAIPLMWGDSIS